MIPEEDIIKGMWDMIKFDFRKLLPKEKTADIDAIDGNAKSMSEAIESHFLISRDRAEKLMRRFAKHYDRIPEGTDFEVKAKQFWSACSTEDLKRAGRSRSALVTIIAKTYNLPRDLAWRQVNAFITALR